MRQVNLVNNRDEIIGQTDLLDAHKGKGKKHQAISLFLFRENKNGGFELLLQQRSKQKIVGAKQWANTLCANVMPGENHLQTLERRLMEELRIGLDKIGLVKEVMVFDYQIPCENGFCENEIDHLLTSILNEQMLADLKIFPNPDEVNGIEWVGWHELKLKKIGEKKLTPWFNLFLETPEIIKKIDQILILWQKQNR